MVHQCVQTAIACAIRKHVYALFSSSNYSQSNQNTAGVIHIDANEKVHALNFEPLEPVIKKDSFYTVIQSYCSFCLQRKENRIPSSPMHELKKISSMIKPKTKHQMIRRFSTNGRQCFSSLPSLLPA